MGAIPAPDPVAAVEELEYAVTRLGLRGAMLYGRTGADLADHPAYDDLHAAAERLRVPLHFHPQTPTQPVVDAYHSGLGAAGPGLATAGPGWYYDLDHPDTFGTRPGGFPFLDTGNGVARSVLENVPFTHQEKVAIGAGNGERRTARSR